MEFISVLQGCTHIVQHTVPLQLRVSDFALQHHEFLFVLLFERVQAPLTVLKLVDQSLLDGNLTRDVGQVGLEVLCQHIHKTESTDLITRWATAGNSVYFRFFKFYLFPPAQSLTPQSSPPLSHPPLHLHLPPQLHHDHSHPAVVHHHQYQHLPYFHRFHMYLIYALKCAVHLKTSQEWYSEDKKWVIICNDLVIL